LDTASADVMPAATGSGAWKSGEKALVDRSSLDAVGAAGLSETSDKSGDVASNGSSTAGLRLRLRGAAFFVAGASEESATTGSGAGSLFG
ncbi:MAG: hypothetical protein WKF54_05035, partial [Nocardioidaceae bacterium]